MIKVFYLAHQKGLAMLGALLLTLATTGGLYAYTFLSTTATLALTGKGDFVAVADNQTKPTWNVWGSYQGKVKAGPIFGIQPEADFTGDMTVIVTLANGSDLVKAYRQLVFKIEVQNSLGNPMATAEYLTLQNGQISIEIPCAADQPYKVNIVDGWYTTNRGGWEPGAEDPLLLCQVLQRGAVTP